MAKSKIPKTSARPAKAPNDHSDPVSLILPYLYIGPCSATSPTSTFIPRVGITHVISVGKKPRSTLDKVVYLRLTIEDDPSADLAKAGEQAIAFIDSARAGSKPCKVLVHCFAGISRSPALVTLYLIQKCGMSLKHALGLVVRARPSACPNPGFLLQLQQAELEFSGRSSLPSDLKALPSKKEDRLALFQEHSAVSQDKTESSGAAQTLKLAMRMLPITDHSGQQQMA